MDDGLESIVQSFERGGSLVFQIIPCHDKVIRSESFFLFFLSLSPLHFVLKSRAHIVLQVYYSKHFLKYLPRVPGRVEEESHLLYLHRLFPWMKRNQGRERETLFWPKVPRLYDRWKIRDISRFSDTAVEIGGEGKIGNFTKTCANANSSLTYGEPPDDQSGIKFSGECVYPAAYRKWNR